MAHRKSKIAELNINSTEKIILEKMINSPGQTFTREEIGKLIKQKPSSRAANAWIRNQKNKEFIEHDLLKPIIHKVIDQLYPYFLGTGLLFMSMFVFIMIILLLNIRVFMRT